MIGKRFLRVLCCALALLPGSLMAHGSVTAEDDLCVIRIGFYSAHFKIFQPQRSANKEFCEDIPAAGESVFVMEYLHEILGSVPIEFRIIRNPTGLGKYTQLEDVEAIEDIEALTVLHREPGIHRDVYTVAHEFTTEGDFLGVVTARHPESEESYMAVFPFHVGSMRWGWAPWIVGIALLAQLSFWFANGKLRRWMKPFFCLALVSAMLPAQELRAQELILSENGHFRADMRSQVEPVPLNSIHGWIIHLETADGELVDDAELTLTGGMPAHDHGLPTAPVVTDYVGQGNYLVEGVRFHMMGEWELVLTVEHEGTRDEVIIPFTL